MRTKKAKKTAMLTTYRHAIERRVREEGCGVPFAPNYPALVEAERRARRAILKEGS